MEKKIILTVILIVSCLLVNSQEKRFNAGLEVGPSLICIKEPCTPYFLNNGIGFYTGAFFEYNANKILSIRLSPAFERKGYWNEYHFNFDYIVLPVLARLGYGSKVRGFVEAGPYFGYLLKSYISKGSQETDPNDPNTTHFYNRFDVGISAGIGLIIPIHKVLTLAIDLRNNFGMCQIVKTEYSENYNWEEKTYSMNLLFSISYNFYKRKFN
ncbi:MAG: porin family protein [Bacteroidales bacterium]|nr:porin family protein [Bacteroidales bacterium]